jgi:hypothetical protein
LAIELAVDASIGELEFFILPFFVSQGDAARLTERAVRIHGHVRRSRAGGRMADKPIHPSS